MLLVLALIANVIVIVAAVARSESDGVGTFGGESSVIYWGRIRVDTATATSRRCDIDTVGDTSIISGLVIAMTARWCVCVCICICSRTFGEPTVISGPVATATVTSRRCGINIIDDTSIITGLEVAVTARMCICVCSPVDEPSVISGPVATATGTATGTAPDTSRRCDIDMIGGVSVLSGLVIIFASRRCGNVMNTVGGTSVIVNTGRVVYTNTTTTSLSTPRRCSFRIVEDEASVLQLPPILCTARRCVVGTVGDWYVLSVTTTSLLLAAVRNCVSFQPLVDVLSGLQTIAKDFLNE